VVADDLDDLDGAERGPQPAEGGELLIVDLGHVTMMPGSAWWVADLGIWRIDCQADCLPFELALFSLDPSGQVQAVDLLIWTVMHRPGQAGKSYESAARSPVQAVARPSEVDDWRQTTANAEASTCRSAAVWPAAGQLAISRTHIYDI
jgi:hypothetical protein